MYVSELVWLGQRLVELGREQMRAYAPGVPIAELIVMGDLLESSPTTIGPISRRTGYAQSRVSTAIAALAARGWVEIAPDPADRRRTVVRVPDRVQAAAAQLRTSTEAQTLQRLLADVPADRREAIVNALQDLYEILRRGPAH